MIGTMTVDTTTPTDIVVTRTFDAPRALVWEAHFEPKHLQAWCLGPDGWDMVVCEVDARVGGAWRYGWQQGDDASTYFEMHGEYLEFDPPARTVHDEYFGDNPPMRVITEFSEVVGRTTVMLTMRLPSEEVRDMVLGTGMTGGMEIGYDRLAVLLEDLDAR